MPESNNVIFKTSINKTIDDLFNWNKSTGDLTPNFDQNEGVPFSLGTLYFTSDGHLVFDTQIKNKTTNQLENTRIWMGKNAYSAIYAQDMTDAQDIASKLSTHTHAWDEIQNKPNTFIASAVMQNATNLNNTNYRILLSGSATNNAETTSLNKSSNLIYNPSTNKLSTGNVDVGGSINITGNANLNGETSIDSATVGNILINGSASFVQSPVAPTPTSGDNSTKLATTAFVSNAVNQGFAINDAMVFKGVIGSNQIIMSLPTQGYNAGWTYRVADAGTYAGEYCEVGDLIIAIKDGPASGSSVINTDWAKIEHNIDGAVFRGAGASNSSVGSGTQPVYVNSSGIVTPITSYSGNAATATNADKIDGYHSLGGTNPSHFYAYSSIFENDPKETPTEDWYVKIILDRRYDANLTNVTIVANYSNIQGKLYLDLDSSEKLWKGYLTTYQYSNILAIKRGHETLVESGESKAHYNVIYVKLKKPIAYNGTVPPGTITIYSPVAIKSIERITLNDIPSLDVEPLIPLKSGYNSNTSIQINNLTIGAFGTDTSTKTISSNSNLFLNSAENYSLIFQSNNTEIARFDQSQTYAFRPNNDCGHSLGTSSYRWNNLYINAIRFGGPSYSPNNHITSSGSENIYFNINGDTSLVVEKTDLRPGANKNVSLGTINNKWYSLYTNSLQVPASGTITSSLPIKVTHTAGGQREFDVVYGDNIEFSLMVGTENTNHGLYDYKKGTNGAWILSADSTNHDWSFNGNANTATSAGRWTTARTITKAGDLQGEFSINGSGNVIDRAYLSYLQANRSNSNTTYCYHRILKAGEITTNYYNSSAILILNQGMIDGKYGIARVIIRTNDITKQQDPIVQITWLVRKGFAVDALQYGLVNNSGKLTADIYLKETGAHGHTLIRVLQDYSGNVDQTGDRITKVNSSAVGSGASGTNTTNNEVYSQLNITTAISIDGVSRTYTKVGEAIDSGIVNKSLISDLATKAFAANITSTTNAIAYYTNTTGTFGSKASANGALYATSANGTLNWGTLPVAQGGTGQTTLPTGEALIGNAQGGITTRQILNNTGAQDIGWSDNNTSIKLVNQNSIAYWNGAYNSGTGSNLRYFSDAYFNSNAFIPRTTGTYNLGTSSYKWNQIYLNSIQFRGSSYTTDNYITSNAQNNIFFSISGINALVVENTDLRPGSGRNITLGTSSNKWYGLYTNSLQVPNSGTITSSLPIQITHASGGQKELQIVYGNNIDFSLMVGTANSNHGLYDNKKGTNGTWILSADSTNHNWSFNGNASTATALQTAIIETSVVGSGLSHTNVIKNYYQSNASIPKEKLLSFYSNAYSGYGAQYLGYYINSGAYGSFIALHYNDNPKFIGITTDTITNTITYDERTVLTDNGSNLTTGALLQGNTTGKISVIGEKGNDTCPIYINSLGIPTQVNQFSSSSKKNFVPHIDGNGAMNIGKYIQFNIENSSKSYDYRMTCSSISSTGDGQSRLQLSGQLQLESPTHATNTVGSSQLIIGNSNNYPALELRGSTTLDSFQIINDLGVLKIRGTELNSGNNTSFSHKGLAICGNYVCLGGGLAAYDTNKLDVYDDLYFLDKKTITTVGVDCKPIDQRSVNSGFSIINTNPTNYKKISSSNNITINDNTTIDEGLYMVSINIKADYYTTNSNTTAANGSRTLLWSGIIPLFLPNTTSATRFNDKFLEVDLSPLEHTASGVPYSTWYLKILYSTDYGTEFYLRYTGSDLQKWAIGSQGLKITALRMGTYYTV